MASETIPRQEEAVVAAPKTGIFVGREGRKRREALLAYVLILPAFLIIFTFGLFPLAFSLYQSTLTGLNRIVGTYNGLGNYIRAVDNLAYVFAFWIAITLVFLAIRRIQAAFRLGREREGQPLLWLPAGVLMAAAAALITRFVFTLLPEMLRIPEQVPRGQPLTRELFLQLLGETFRLPQVQSTLGMAILVFAIALATAYLTVRFAPRSPFNSQYYNNFVQAGIMLIGAAALSWLTYTEIQRAYAEALESGESLAIWSQLVTISAGIVLLLLSWFLWRTAAGQASTIKTFLRLAGAGALAVGAWVLIGELPAAIAEGDSDWWEGLEATVFFAALTIPMQFTVALTLATILFENIKGKTFFRMIFFMPYIAPLVGTAAAFRIIFSGRGSAPVNSLLSTLGIQPLGWLNEPTGIFQLMTGPNIDLPSWLAGPSLALVTIVLYNVWTYVGFDMVIFLAGLGNIPRELYEAAEIDGSDRWAKFRHITLPLLSPTIYFLMLLAVIGTFKAFNRIYVMRTGAALGTTDTATVVIFEVFNRDTRYGYASALAILLLIIVVVLTVVNNRISEKRVFYG